MILSDNFCLLIGVFRPLMFKVIIYKVGLIFTIFMTVFYFLLLFCVPLFVSHSFYAFCSLLSRTKKQNLEMLYTSAEELQKWGRVEETQ